MDRNTQQLNDKIDKMYRLLLIISFSLLGIGLTGLVTYIVQLLT